MKRPAVVILLVALAAAVHLASANWHVHHGPMNTDEGFYAVCTRGVAQGEVPYRDFGFTQPPFVLYANALPLKVVGFGLFVQRAVNGVWAALALALAAGWLARRTNLACGFGLALLFSLCAPWMYFMHLGKTYGFTTFLVTLAMWAFLAMSAGPRRNAVLGLLLVLGLGTRLTAVPFFGVLWLLALWPGRRPTATEIIAAIGSIAAAALVLLLPFWWLAPEQVRFWVFDFHLVSLGSRTWQLDWQDIVTLAPAAWLLGAYAFSIVVIWGRWQTRETGVLLAAGLTLAANLLPTGAYDEYGTPFLLALATAAAALLYDDCRLRSQGTAIALVLAIVVAQFGTAPLFSATDRVDWHSWWLTPKSESYNYALPAHLASARQIVAQTLKPDAPFIGPNLILATETGRRVPSQLYMGSFSFTTELPPDRAARLHLATPEQLARWFNDPAVTVLGFFQRGVLDYGWSMPSFREVPDKLRTQLFAPLLERYAAEQDEENFLVLVKKR